MNAEAGIRNICIYGVGGVGGFFGGKIAHNITSRKFYNLLKLKRFF